jgi:hypothetical protein
MHEFEYKGIAIMNAPEELCADCGEYQHDCTCGPLKIKAAAFEAAIAAQKEEIKLLKKLQEIKE